ncbi:hypothetical protein [Methylocella silvestris]|uniref:hypothetical protein n=1 Tax=Methylocella silvestris TaxID=199596 RepID=UPI0011D0E0AC|nr:hypothetical protein [Methylocella silvestris]
MLNSRDNRALNALISYPKNVQNEMLPTHAPLGPKTLRADASPSIIRRIAFLAGAPNCRIACVDDFASGDCLQPPSSGEAQTLLGEFDALRNHVVIQHDGVIKKSDVMNIFHVDGDGCNRGDTFINNGQIENSGEGDCYLSAELPVQDVKEKGVSLYMPIHVIGAVNINGRSIDLKFSDRKSAPLLNFDDGGLQNEWGGAVRSISADQTRVMFGTDTGCIMLSNE